MPSPGEYALVLDPIVRSDTHTCRFSRVLINGGSSINLLYQSSMEKLGIPLAQLKPSRLISHKYRGSCVAFSISKSVKPNEELKVG
jgi:hypothetical protein